MNDLRSEDSEGIKLCIHERCENVEERADNRWQDVALLQQKRADELEYYLHGAQKKLKDLEQKYKGDMQFVLGLFKKHVPDVIFDEYNLHEMDKPDTYWGNGEGVLAKAIDILERDWGWKSK